MPAWLVAPGLLVPPIFLPLLLCLVDRPAAPSMPLPHLDAAEADQRLRLVAATDAATAFDGDENELLRTWRALERASLSARGPGGDETRLAMAQQAMRAGCKAVASGGHTERLLLVGDSVALALTRAVTRLELEPAEAEREVLAVGGRFLEMARATGLIDRRGRLRAHPIVPYALAQVSWRTACGLQPETGLAPIELDAVDVLRIQFGQHLPQAVRVAAVRRFSGRHPAYPSAQALAAILLESHDPYGAADQIRAALSREPGNLALRSYLLYAQAAQE